VSCCKDSGSAFHTRSSSTETSVAEAGVCCLSAALTKAACVHVCVCAAAKVLLSVRGQHLGCAESVRRVLCAGVDGVFAVRETLGTLTAVYQPHLRPVALGMIQFNK